MSCEATAESRDGEGRKGSRAQVAGDRESTQRPDPAVYVGTPALGTSRAAAAAAREEA